MRFKTDENLPIQVVELLRQHGHDASSVSEQQLGGHPDQSIADVCRKEQRVIVTLDLDFSDIRQYAPAEYPGIIVLRPAHQNVSSVLRMMHRVLQFLSQEAPDGRLWIVDDHQVRIR